jgi:methylase of polypeptide subunit release factors
MHAKWVGKRKRHEFKIGYNPSEMMRTFGKDNTIRIEKDGYFPTPREITQLLIATLDLPEDKSNISILEPSAGDGAMVRELVQAGVPAEMIDVIETNEERRQTLKESGFNVVWDDFDTYLTKKRYDFVLMNPPFENDADARHIIKAVKLLKPEGKLAALSSSALAWKPYGGKVRALASKSLKPLPEGSFKESGTAISVLSMIIERNGLSDEQIENIEPADAIDFETKQVKEEVDLPSPETLAAEIIKNMDAANQIMKNILNMLNDSPKLFDQDLDAEESINASNEEESPQALLLSLTIPKKELDAKNTESPKKPKTRTRNKPEASQQLSLFA